MRPLLLLFLTIITARAAELPAADPFERKEVAPAAVVKLAEAYVKSIPQAEKRAEASRDFKRMFLTGFAEPNVSIGTPSEAASRGLEAGHVYRRKNPDKLKEIFEGYGYAATEADGLWKFGFETSEFKPVKNPQENWWITVIGEEGEALKDAERVHVQTSQDRVQVHVVGFLSPKGHYGHFGVGERELYATSVTAAKGK